MESQKIIAILLTQLILFGISQGQISDDVEKSTELATISETTNSTESVEDLLKDFQWFMEGIANFAEAADHVLPEAMAVEVEDRQSAFHLSQFILSGVKQFIAGVKDIAKFTLHAFGIEDTRQSRQLTQTNLILGNIGKVFKSWFKSLRRMFAKFMELYEYYITELLLGKCIGKYLGARYPDRFFYEYPFLMIYEIFRAFIFVQRENFINSMGTDVEINQIDFKINNESAKIDDILKTHSAEEMSLEQNEIPHNDIEKYEKRRSLHGRNSRGRALLNTTAGAILDDAEEEDTFDSLQKCLKIYAAETMIRNIRKMFL